MSLSSYAKLKARGRPVTFAAVPDSPGAPQLDLWTPTLLARSRPRRIAELVALLRLGTAVDVIASVITLQALHGLSDAEAVDAVTFDLRWKAACGLAITAGAFHPTTLTYWRRRLALSERPNRIFDAVKQVVAETGVLRPKTRRALDSTVLDDAVATQDTVTQLIGAIRRVRREVPGAVEVIAAHCRADCADRGDHRPRAAACRPVWRAPEPDSWTAAATPAGWCDSRTRSPSPSAITRSPRRSMVFDGVTGISRVDSSCPK